MNERAVYIPVICRVAIEKVSKTDVYTLPTKKTLKPTRVANRTISIISVESRNSLSWQADRIAGERGGNKEGERKDLQA